MAKKQQKRIEMHFSLKDPSSTGESQHNYVILRMGTEFGVVKNLNRVPGNELMKAIHILVKQHGKEHETILEQIKDKDFGGMAVNGTEYTPEDIAKAINGLDIAEQLGGFSP
jgi:hypothetical protein